MPYVRSEAPARVDVPRLGRIDGATNPESVELLADGEHVLFTNCTMKLGHPAYRAGQGLVYMHRQAFLSLGRIAPDGSLSLVKRRIAEGLTGTLGIDILKRPAGRFPAGTAFVAAGGKPIVEPGSDKILGGPGQAKLLIVEPGGSALIGEISLNEDSALGRRFNGIDQPNGAAADNAGNLYFGDIPNSNPVAPMPSPVPSAVYRIPNEAIDGLAAGSDAAAALVTRVEMPGWVNGLCALPQGEGVYAVSCSFHCPVGGGIYRLSASDFSSGVLPPPVVRGLGKGILDGVGITRRGTLLASAPLEQTIHAFTADGRHFIVTVDGANPVSLPADFNVCYPHMLNGEPALLVPDLTMGGPPETGSVSLLDFSGY